MNSQKHSEVTFREFLTLLKPYKIAISIALIIALISSTLSIFQPILLSKIIDNINDNILGQTVVFFSIIVLLSAILNSIKQYILESISENLVSSLRIQIVNRSIKYKIEVFDTKKIGDLASILSADTAQLRGILSQGIVELVSQTFTMIFALIMMFYLDVQLFGVSLLAVLSLLMCGLLLGKKTRPIAKDLQEVVGELSSELERTLRGIRTIRAFLSEDIFIERMSSVVTNATKIGKKVAIFKSIISGFSNIALQIMLITIIGIGSIRVAAGIISIGNLSAFIMYVMLVLTPAAMLGGVLSSINEGLGAYSRIKLALELPVEEDVNSLDVLDKKGNQALQIKNLTFKYDNSDKNILNKIDISVNGPGVTALVGPSGSGKTTIFELIERFYDSDNGSIELYGNNIYDLPIKVLRSKITFVEQNASIFSGTVLENLQIANQNASRFDCLYALNLVNLFQDIPTEEILDRVIGESGITLSGGEKQRLSLARALISPNDIILLDETTSNLDSINESKIQQLIKDLSSKKTVLIIAHRLSTIQNADSIYLIREGEVHDFGTHQELLSRNKLYKELVETQFINKES
ncbi:ABC transporter ATP-binding protein [Streptococcus suis]|uniref:Lipid A export ATP-binding/permease protein msbA n=1 Tax=Streptococcus suis TaxID=1307 RepID=A0A0Z8G3A0_STRSU|nr:ABC transporter ATP-binding protein [Streptococcus suis]MCQ9225062.1 ABC transporter ATP-binding protein/permease [Streptococcus suis]MCQ9227334.1 ABC transporter ATP-binding protein/permease [Streptococcus suis]MCQ9241526.1 ABC transporter ATP-binding protein/permease [Streptococcus suis]MCQ9273629.1 ABC transporter ATP-binding protein/permease [Streptococcus suis]MDE7535690.1 ABC transporter ATP-binding protein [Streptococcus suis]